MCGVRRGRIRSRHWVACDEAEKATSMSICSLFCIGLWYTCQKSSTVGFAFCCYASLNLTASNRSGMAYIASKRVTANKVTYNIAKYMKFLSIAKSRGLWEKVYRRVVGIRVQRRWPAAMKLDSSVGRLQSRGPLEFRKKRTVRLTPTLTL